MFLVISYTVLFSVSWSYTIVSFSIIITPYSILLCPVLSSHFLFSPSHYPALSCVPLLLSNTIALCH